MLSENLLKKYFPELNDLQIRQFSKLEDLYKDWNEKVNLISRKDVENIFVHHVLHSLAIAKVVKFEFGTSILDIGTGGGFPGIPLAIVFPDCKFMLIDSIGKKIKVVKSVAEEINLTNVYDQQIRAEKENAKFDFIVSRAVCTSPEFINYSKKKINSKSFNSISNGILYLKGGDFLEEIENLKYFVKIFNIKNFFQEDFFQTKKVVYIKQ